MVFFFFFYMVRMLLFIWCFEDVDDYFDFNNDGDDKIFFGFCEFVWYVQYFLELKFLFVLEKFYI